MTDLLTNGRPTMFGTKIFVSVNATEHAERWPVKRRSKRLHKKLTKLRGPQFYDKPAAFLMPFGLVVHPEIYAELTRRNSPVTQKE